MFKRVIVYCCQVTIEEWDIIKPTPQERAMAVVVDIKNTIDTTGQYLPRLRHLFFLNGSGFWDFFKQLFYQFRLLRFFFFWGGGGIWQKKLKEKKEEKWITINENPTSPTLLGVLL